MASDNKWSFGQIILGVDRREEYSNTYSGAGAAASNNNNFFVPSNFVENAARRNIDGDGVPPDNMGDIAGGGGGGGLNPSGIGNNVGSSLFKSAELILNTATPVKIPGQMVPIGQVGEDHISGIVKTYKRVFFRFLREGVVYQMNMFYSTLANAEHYSLSEMSISVKCPGKYNLSCMFPNDPSSTVALPDARTAARPNKFNNVIKNDASNRGGNNNNNNNSGGGSSSSGGGGGSGGKDADVKLNNPRNCSNGQTVGAATCMTNSATQLWEYICRKCPDKSFRGYYDCGNNFLVHALAVGKFDIFHLRADNTVYEARGNCAVNIEGQRGDHKNTASKCYINGEDAKMYDAFIPKNKEGVLYQTNATIAPDWESIHGPHLNEKFSHDGDSDDDKFHKVHMGTSFFIYMCYNFVALLKEYVAENKSYPEAISADMYAEFIAVSSDPQSWPEINIYARADLLDDRPFHVIQILDKNPSSYLWRCENFSLKFCIPVQWAMFCSRAFQRSSNSLHCLVPSKMAIEMAYQRGYPTESDEDVFVSGVIKAQAFIPFYCFYAVREQQQQ